MYHCGVACGKAEVFLWDTENMDMCMHVDSFAILLLLNPPVLEINGWDVERHYVISTDFTGSGLTPFSTGLYQDFNEFVQ